MLITQGCQKVRAGQPGHRRALALCSGNAVSDTTEPRADEVAQSGQSLGPMKLRIAHIPREVTPDRI